MALSTVGLGYGLADGEGRQPGEKGRGVTWEGGASRLEEMWVPYPGGLLALGHAWALLSLSENLQRKFLGACHWRVAPGGAPLLTWRASPANPLLELMAFQK